jgi:predicted TIM-barrel fold metal-dependent hydrolase
MPGDVTHPVGAAERLQPDRDAPGSAAEGPGSRGEPRQADAVVIDCDVHNALPVRDALKPYLPSRWHVYYDQGVNTQREVTIGARPHPGPYTGVYRRDSLPGRGGPGGSEYDLLRSQLLDAKGIRRAILHPVSEIVQIPLYGEAGAAIAAALNDWMVEEWLERDDRLRAAITVPFEDGPRAALEIEHRAGDRRFVKVLMMMSTREPLGHPKYWPIYEAAVAYGLPISAHVAGFSGTGTMATGWPSYWMEHNIALPQAYPVQAASLAYSGVFDRFPSLQFVFEEGGLGWLPPLLWRLDRTWRAMRDFAPHLDRLPSEVLREHLWLTTQPLDEPERPQQLVQLFEELELDDRIVFATDYPHWDADDPVQVLSRSLLGVELWSKIMWRNAETLFGFDA